MILYQRFYSSILQLVSIKTPSRTTEYVIWQHMRYRCHNPKNYSYKWYGGRGVVVCDEWRYSFNSFLNCVGKRPTKKHSLDRINHNGNYEPGNVRWATSKQQANNKTNNRRITYKNRTLNLTQWQEVTGIDLRVIWGRLNRGWSIAESLGYKVHKRKHKPRSDLIVDKVCTVCKIDYKGVKSSRVCSRKCTCHAYYLRKKVLRLEHEQLRKKVLKD